MMGYIDIPKINILLPVYHGTSEEVLQSGIGHLKILPYRLAGKAVMQFYQDIVGWLMQKCLRI